MGLPKRFRPARRLAIVSSVGALVLAIGPNPDGMYDAKLAVLTLTLIAIIWYTYFTYRVANRELPTVLRLRVEGKMYPDVTKLKVKISNTSPRTVSAKVFLTVSVDDKQVSLGGLYSGKSCLDLGPFDELTTPITVDSNIMEPKQGSFNEFIFTRKELRVKLSVNWHDDLDEAGEIGPKFWYTDRETKELWQVVAPENIVLLFPDN